MNDDESGHRACIEEYTLIFGKTVDELRAAKITSVKCRCKPHTNTPHCGGFYVAQETAEKVAGHQVISWKRLTALHGEEIGAEPHFPPSVIRQLVAELEHTA